MNLSLKDNLKSSFWVLWILIMSFGFGLLLIIGNYKFSILVNSWHKDSLDFLFQNLTYLGDGIFVFLVALLFIFFKKKLALLTLSSLSITTIIVQFLKRIIFKEQLRPSKIFHDLIQNGSWNTIEGLNLYEKFSFPSGHTALVFCLCITLSLYIKRNNWSLFFITIAFLVGFSRIYLTQHFLIDVLYGALIGSITALLTYTYLEKLLSKISFIKNKDEKG